MRVPFRDLSRQNDPLREEIDAAVGEVISRGSFILGSAVLSFEEDLANYLGRDHVIGTGNATDALYLALQAAGVRAGDTVLTSTFTIMPSISGIYRLGATPKFLDIDPHTYNIDPENLWKALEQAEVKPKALIVVHLYGQSADMDLITAICNHFGVIVIEDCAQALGAVYTSKFGPRKVGSMGKLSCFSFFPTKPLGGMGDGGAVATDSPQLAEQLRQLRQHGWGSDEKYTNYTVGINSRLDSIQAAILRVKLPRLDEWTSEVQRRAAIYDSQLAAVTPQLSFGRESHSYHLYTIQVDDREALSSTLREAGVGNGVYYPKLMHGQPIVKSCTSLPCAEQAVWHILSLPLFPGMTDLEQEYVIEKLNENV